MSEQECAIMQADAEHLRRNVLVPVLNRPVAFAAVAHIAVSGEQTHRAVRRSPSSLPLTRHAVKASVAALSSAIFCSMMVIFYSDLMVTEGLTLPARREMTRPAQQRAFLLSAQPHNPPPDRGQPRV